MALTTTTPARLDPVVEHQVRRLAARVEEADGVAPLNEEALLHLAQTDVDHVLAVDDTVVGYGQHDPRTRTAQICADPARHDETVRAVLAALLPAHPGTAVWLFGDRADTRRVLTGQGFSPARTLHRMDRALDDSPAPEPPAGVRVTTFRPGDEGALLAVNAAAFASHPEQGALTLADLRLRMAQDWFDPGGLFIAWKGDDALGFIWTKRHSETLGEVYVIGISPAAAGQGLGRTLLATGLSHLAAIGCRQGMLFVEGDSATAHGMYERSGFAVTRTDVLYHQEGDPS